MNRFRRALRLLSPGIGVGLVLAFTASVARWWVPHTATWLLTAGVTAAVFFALGYVSPTRDDTDEDDEIDDDDSDDRDDSVDVPFDDRATVVMATDVHKTDVHRTVAQQTRPIPRPGG